MSKASRLAELRQARGWSQAALAGRSGISRAEISAVETGRLVPSVAVALRLAAVFDESVEAMFGGAAGRVADWAWQPPAGSADPRVWRASVHRRTLAFPIEPTAAGAIAHDGRFKGRSFQPVSPGTAPERTLVVAGCDPLAGLLAREVAAQYGVRVLPLLRSSGQALELLRQGLVHAAGVHLTDPSGRPVNDRIVRSTLGAGYRVVHQLRWEAGIAVVSHRRERSAAALLRARVRWVNREEGSAARRAFDALLASRPRPAGYEHVVSDHRAVTATVSSGWAEAGVCVRPAALEARLPFIPLHREAYELCIAESQFDDPRVVALIATMQSPGFRRLLADVPGCIVSETGDVRSIA